jgi:hypothetical protein
MWFCATNSDTLDGVRAIAFIVWRTASYIWQVSDSVTTHTNMHVIGILTWAASNLVGSRS